MGAAKNVLELIGNTSMVRVNQIDTGKCELYLKLESHNPAGSIKDRIALNMEYAGWPAILFDWQGRNDRNIIIACGAVEQMQIRAYKKPSFVRREVQGIMRRTPKKHVFKT